MASSIMKINRTLVAASVTDLFHTCFCPIPSVSQRQLINHGTDKKSEKLIKEIKTCAVLIPFSRLPSLVFHWQK